jgi:hypothetical protein
MRRIATASPPSSVVTAPPSPVVTIFRGWNERQARAPRLPHGRPCRFAPRAPAAFLEHRHALRELLDAHWPPEQVDGDDRLRPRSDDDLRGVEVHRLGIDVDEHGLGPDERDHVRRRRERVGGNEHLVAGPDPEREHREVERSGTRGDDDRVLCAAGHGEPALELLHLRAHRQLPALEHLSDGLRLGGSDVGPGQPN